MNSKISLKHYKNLFTFHSRVWSCGVIALKVLVPYIHLNFSEREELLVFTGTNTSNLYYINKSVLLKFAALREKSRL